MFFQFVFYSISWPNGPSLSCYQSAVRTGYNSSRLFSTATALRGGEAEISSNASDTALVGIIERRSLKDAGPPRTRLKGTHSKRSTYETSTNRATNCCFRRYNHSINFFLSVLVSFCRGGGVSSVFLACFVVLPLLKGEFAR
jgi:hypothetical protein